jgi:hypothetical protein
MKEKFLEFTSVVLNEQTTDLERKARTSQLSQHSPPQNAGIWADTATVTGVP